MTKEKAKLGTQARRYKSLEEKSGPSRAVLAQMLVIEHRLD
jgi:hypothetical protein